MSREVALGPIKVILISILYIKNTNYTFLKPFNNLAVRVLLGLEPRTPTARLWF